MSADFDRDSLVTVFLTEASQGLTTLHDVLQGKKAAAAPPADVEANHRIAHTLRGSASMYGFAGVASLAEVLENVFEHQPEALQAKWQDLIGPLRDLVDTLREQLVAIGTKGSEEPGFADRWKDRFAGLLQWVMRPDDAVAQPQSESFSDDYLNPQLDPEVISYFAPEAQEYLDALESSVLRLEREPDNKDLIQQLFRTAHTLKGSAYTVGFKAIGDLTHYVEDIMGAIRDGRMRPSHAVAEAIFKSVDVIRLLMKRDAGAIARTRQEFATIMGQLKAANAGVMEAVAVPAMEQAGQHAPHTEASRTRSDEAPAAEKVERPEPAHAQAQSAQAQTAKADETAVIRVSKDRLERLMNLVGELVISRGRLEQRLVMLEQLSQQVLGCRNRMQDTVRTFEERHAFTFTPSPSLGTSASAGAGGSPPAISGFPGLADLGSLEFDKYDDFNILARRIAEVSADVSESMSQLSGSIRKAREDMSSLQQLTLGMRDEIARSRMVPVGTPFTRFQRAVRENAKATNKEATLAVSGANTEVDTVVVERLVDPLIHLVRNAVYHGIEPPDVRVQRGKPPSGTIYLNAAHRGNALVIEIEDDGGGLDIARIKAKAVSVGLLHSEAAATMSDAEAIKLIFLPGFSTAAGIGDQAGRGVGLDVVKRALEAMNGQIEVETEPGVGTKFTLRLPLTLLISTALMVRAAGQRYAFPLPSVREVVMPAPGAVQDVGGRPVLQVGEEAVEVRSLAQLLGGEPPAAAMPTPVVIVRMPTGVLGVAVDELLGRQEIVIKSLGTLRPFQESCFGGATIDPDGSVVLVVDVGRLLGGPRRESLSTEPRPSIEDLRPTEPAASGYGPEDTRILLIDDSLSIRKFVGKMLEAAGYDVETAVDGEEGLRKASTGMYRVIITDLEMPKLNGYEVIQALRDRPQTKLTPILVMTTRAGEKHRQMALNMGASGYIAKPVEERSFIQEVGHWSGRVTSATK